MVGTLQERVRCVGSSVGVMRLYVRTGYSTILYMFRCKRDVAHGQWPPLRSTGARVVIAMKVSRPRIRRELNAVGIPHLVGLRSRACESWCGSGMLGGLRRAVGIVHEAGHDAALQAKVYRKTSDLVLRTARSTISVLSSRHIPRRTPVATHARIPNLTL